MKTLAWLLACLVVALSVPVDSWKAMSGTEQDALVLMTITEHCREQAETTGVLKFRIRIKEEGGKMNLHIDPVRPEV